MRRNSKSAVLLFYARDDGARHHHGRRFVGDHTYPDPVAEAQDHVADRVRDRRAGRPERRADDLRDVPTLRRLPHREQVARRDIEAQRARSGVRLFVVGERGARTPYGVTPCMYAYCATVTPYDETINFVVPLTGRRCASP